MHRAHFLGEPEALEGPATNLPHPEVEVRVGSALAPSAPRLALAAAAAGGGGGGDSHELLASKGTVSEPQVAADLPAVASKEPAEGRLAERPRKVFERAVRIPRPALSQRKVDLFTGKTHEKNEKKSQSFQRLM